MTAKRTLQPHETWDALQKMAFDDEIERVASLSEEELDRELAMEGLDPKAVRARGADLAARRGAGAVPAVEVPARATPGGRRRSVIPFAAAAAAAGAVAVGIPLVAREMAKHGPVESSGPEASTLTPRARAAALRRAAALACEDKRWDDCGQRLDEARGIDPAGEETSEVKEMRRTIEDGLRPWRRTSPEHEKPPRR